MKLQVTKYLALELTEPQELIELISPSDLVEFTQALSCWDEVIKSVADQIINGQTKDGYCGSETPTQSTPSTPLQSVRRAIAINSSDIAKNEIESLQIALARMEELKEEYMNKYYDLYHGRMPR